MQKPILIAGILALVVLPVLAHNASKEHVLEGEHLNAGVEEDHLRTEGVNKVISQEEPPASAEAVASQEPATVPEAWTEKPNVQTDGVEINNWRGNVSGQHRELQRQY